MDLIGKNYDLTPSFSLTFTLRLLLMIKYYI